MAKVGHNGHGLPFSEARSLRHQDLFISLLIATHVPSRKLIWPQWQKSGV
jgi:predicted butyrate kinase (DUF1464 family)